MTPEEAEAAIGRQDGKDYLLEPLQHADGLPPQARALAAALRDPRIAVLAQQYTRHDGEAGKAQKAYKDTLGQANLAVLAATVLGAVMMAAQMLATTYSNLQGLNAVVIVAGLLAGLAAAFGSMWLFRAREGNLLQRWLTSRAKAEADRVGYFATLADLPGDADLRLLTLEYFRRYQLDVQRNFFDRRGNEHRASAERTLRRGGIAAGISSLAGIGVGIGGLSGGSWAALGALSVVGGALAAYAGAYEAMSQDKRNAERYEHSLEALDLLASKIGETRTAIVNGSADALKAFVTAVNEQLMLENRQWLEAGKGAESALASLETALAKARKPDPKKE
jgi:roadblock/LC7 domain-containing protein